MIPNQWYPVLESRKLRGRPLGIKRLGQEMVLWRDQAGRARAALDRCPHRGARPSHGQVIDGELQCPWHGFRFGADGACRLMPCEGRDASIPSGMRLDLVPAQEAHGLLWLFHGSADPAAVEIRWFDEFRDGTRGVSGTSFSWPFNYVRSLESNFDVHHFPFVHGGGRLSGERVDILELSETDGHLVSRGQLRHEHRDSGLPFRIEYKPPSITLLEFPRFFFVVADCPVDDGNTWRYARYSQTLTRIPGLARFVSWLFLWADLRLFQNRQDGRIMATQRPNRPDQAIDRLVAADAPTAAFKNLRHRLIREAEEKEAGKEEEFPPPGHSGEPVSPRKSAASH